MKLRKTGTAVGQILCHDMTRIVPDVVKDAVFRKGRCRRGRPLPGHRLRLLGGAAAPDDQGRSGRGIDAADGAAAAGW